MDGFTLAFKSFMLPIFWSYWDLAAKCWSVFVVTTERPRDEAFAAVALAWPVAVLIGSFPFWLGGVFHGPLGRWIHYD